MQTFRNELKVHRGETFTIDKLLQNRDGTPYIIPYDLPNAYFLISVSNTQYSQEDRYIRNYWIDLSKFPRFYLTRPMPLSDIKTSAAEGSAAKYEHFSDIDAFPITGVVDGKFISMEPTYAVFTDGSEFKYWDAVNSNWEDYECRIIKTFLSRDTIEWQAQNYLYSIQLVYGENTFTHLQSLAREYVSPEEYPTHEDEGELKQALYELLKDKVDFPDNFEPSQPIVNLSSIPILSPTQIKVINYTQGDITW